MSRSARAERWNPRDIARTILMVGLARHGKEQITQTVEIPNRRARDGLQLRERDDETLGAATDRARAMQTRREFAA